MMRLAVLFALVVCACSEQVPAAALVGDAMPTDATGLSPDDNSPTIPTDARPTIDAHCGGYNEACCPGALCEVGRACWRGRCLTCGQAGMECCPKGACRPGVSGAECREGWCAAPNCAPHGASCNTQACCGGAKCVGPILPDMEKRCQCLQGGQPGCTAGTGCCGGSYCAGLGVGHPQGWCSKPPLNWACDNYDACPGGLECKGTDCGWRCDDGGCNWGCKSGRCLP